MTGERILPNAGLVNKWTPGSNGWATGMDSDLAMMDALLFLCVKSSKTTTPPSSPVQGDRYIVPASATGSWVGKTNQIAIWIDSAWVFYAPKKGWKSEVEDTSSRTVFSGTAWIADIGGIPTASTGDLPHRYWRIRINTTAFGTYGSIAELAFASTAGGTNLFGTGTPSSSPTAGSGFEPNRAIDGNGATWWSANESTVSYWQYDFGALGAVVVAEIRMQARNDSQSGANCSPATWDLLSSDDGSNFLLVKSFTSAAWTPGSSQTFSSGLSTGSGSATTAGGTYVFPQSSPATTWAIPHNLNRYPSVTTVDSAGSEVEGAPSYVDANNVRVDFGFPFSGTAYLN